MQDGIGTTTYAYNPITAIPVLGAGKLASVNGPLPNSLVSYQYDALGRTTARAINGVAATTAFDALGRPNLMTNVLGAFQYSYAGATARPALDAYPNGQTNLYAYYNNLGDERLLQIQHLKPNGTLLSGFGYAYNPVGQIRPGRISGTHCRRGCGCLRMMPPTSLPTLFPPAGQVPLPIMATLTILPETVWLPRRTGCKPRSPIMRWTNWRTARCQRTTSLTSGTGKTG